MRSLTALVAPFSTSLNYEPGALSWVSWRCVADMQTAIVPADVLGRLRQTTQVVLKFFAHSLNERPTNILGQYLRFSNFSTL